MIDHKWQARGIYLVLRAVFFVGVNHTRKGWKDCASYGAEMSG